MGATIPYFGARGKGVEMWWRPVLGRDHGSVRYPVLRSMRWLWSNFWIFYRLVLSGPDRHPSDFAK
eukprot:6854788-Pyramimonas_sp.AAC.1